MKIQDLGEQMLHIWFKLDVLWRKNLNQSWLKNAMSKTQSASICDTQKPSELLSCPLFIWKNYTKQCLCIFSCPLCCRQPKRIGLTVKTLNCFEWKTKFLLLILVFRENLLNCKNVLTRQENPILSRQTKICFSSIFFMWH